MPLQQVHGPNHRKIQTQPNTSLSTSRLLTAQARQDPSKLTSLAADSGTQDGERATHFGHLFANIPTEPPALKTPAPV